MPAILYLSLAGNLVAICALLYTAARLGDLRLDLDDANETIADLKTAHRALGDTNASLLTELIELRAKDARRMAPLREANARRKADAKGRVAAH
jgi:hypothetical protein